MHNYRRIKDDRKGFDLGGMPPKKINATVVAVRRRGTKKKTSLRGAAIILVTESDRRVFDAKSRGCKVLTGVDQVRYREQGYIFRQD